MDNNAAAQATEPAIADPVPPSPLELEERYAAMDARFHKEVKPFLDEFKALKLAVIDSHAVGEMWQADDGIVFQVADKKGQWVDFTPFEIKRTRRPGEAKGTLAKTDAEKAGFTIE